MLTDLQGQIERITYTNEENGYTVAKVKVYNRSDLVTVVGNILSPTPGEVLKMKGEWVNNPKYGEQFKVVHYKSLVPASVSGIQKYLGSGLIKGIGQSEVLIPIDKRKSRISKTVYNLPYRLPPVTDQNYLDMRIRLRQDTLQRFGQISRPIVSTDQYTDQSAFFLSFCVGHDFDCFFTFLISLAFSTT